jgi:hypothetical protein
MHPWICQMVLVVNISFDFWFSCGMQTQGHFLVPKMKKGMWVSRWDYNKPWSYSGHVKLDKSKREGSQCNLKPFDDS